MAQTVDRARVTTGYRIRRGNVVCLAAMPYQTGCVTQGVIRVVYDDGTEDDLFFDPSITTTSGATVVIPTKQAARDGWIVGGAAGLISGTNRSVRGYGSLLLCSDKNLGYTMGCIGQGFF